MLGRTRVVRRATGAVETRVIRGGWGEFPLDEGLELYTESVPRPFTTKVSKALDALSGRTYSIVWNILSLTLLSFCHDVPY